MYLSMSVLDWLLEGCQMLLTDVVTNRLECDLDFSQTRQSQRSLFLSNFALILLISAPPDSSWLCYYGSKFHRAQLQMLLNNRRCLFSPPSGCPEELPSKLVRTNAAKTPGGLSNTTATTAVSWGAFRVQFISVTWDRVWIPNSQT